LKRSEPLPLDSTKFLKPPPYHDWSVGIKDCYSSYLELQQVEREGRDYRIHVREGLSDIAVMAPHGGGIEPGTHEIADAVAGSEHSFYCFEGIKKSRNLRLHLTSTHFDEDRGVRIANSVQVVVAIHGSNENEEVVYLGGLNTGLKEKIRAQLTHAGFVVKESPRTALQGRNPANICNRGASGAGVQLEISQGLRQKLFVPAENDGTKSKNRLFDDFVSSLRKALGAR
jgi:phage replication-related protein YjqB (UPF0714/DUF867 family)